MALDTCVRCGDIRFTSHHQCRPLWKAITQEEAEDFMPYADRKIEHKLFAWLHDPANYDEFHDVYCHTAEEAAEAIVKRDNSDLSSSEISTEPTPVFVFQANQEPLEIRRCYVEIEWEPSYFVRDSLPIEFEKEQEDPIPF